MNTEHRVTKTRGWDVVAGAFLVMFFIQGARTVIGVMFKPMIQELAWSRSAISLAAFINMAVFALSLTLVGKYYDRYGAKRIVVLSSLLVGISYISIALVQSLGSFILLYGILAALGFGGTSIPCSVP
jgi:sugar phosphate permease